VLIGACSPTKVYRGLKKKTDTDPGGQVTARRGTRKILDPLSRHGQGGYRAEEPIGTCNTRAYNKSGGGLVKADTKKDMKQLPQSGSKLHSQV